MRCAKCGTDNRDGRRFCAQCDDRLELPCLSCGGQNEPGERFCGECGFALGAPAAVASQPQQQRASVRLADASDTERLEGERKTVTALFADLKGSTELMEDLDPEEARAVIAEICGWFTEGFDTADLKDARALLDKLAS